MPVLLRETLALLAPQPGETAVDCTIGRGGHAVELATAVGERGFVIGFDLDRENLEYATKRVEARDAPFRGFNESFLNGPRRLAELDVKANVLLADLGFSSNQMEDPQRGLGFRHDGPLDMRLDAASETTAAELVASLPESELADVIYRYGEEPLSRKIARKLAQERRIRPIETTAELAHLVVEAYGPRARRSRLHPATRTFMALRIAVNDELGALEGLLEAVERGAAQAGEGRWLRVGARVAVISFHSLEDRLVKRRFADMAQRGLAVRLTKKPITAGDVEVAANVRSRSAKLRAVRIEGPQGR
jgi:16S rRNA (cytosine1402-N4)-methyltransferase